MTEPRPLPPDARASQSQELVTFTCPEGHPVLTTFTKWEVTVLSEDRFGGNVLDLTCPTCQTPFRVEL